MREYVEINGRHHRAPRSGDEGKLVYYWGPSARRWFGPEKLTGFYQDGFLVAGARMRKAVLYTPEAAR